MFLDIGVASKQTCGFHAHGSMADLPFIAMASQSSTTFLPPEWVRDTLGWPTGRGVRVGVINSGFDRTLRDARVLPGVSFVDPDDDLATKQTDDDHDRAGAGTSCAHLVLSIAPEARVVPIRIFGEGLESSPSTLHKALLWAAEQRLDVVAIGGGTTIAATVRPLYIACEKSRRMRTVLVASGHLDRIDSYPAIFENVIGVSSGDFTSPFDFRYHPIAAEECEAWGDDQLVVGLNGQWQKKNGTMYAAANVAAIVALLRERFPGAPLERIRTLLQRFAV
jgi:thermitase